MIVRLTRWVGSEMQTIEVNIDEQGDIEATVQGVAGPGCADVGKFLDELGQVTEDQNTAEFYQPATTDTSVYGGMG